MVKNPCIVNNEEELKEILKRIAPLLRNKKRSILIMGAHYEEVNMETQKEIVTYMSTLPKETKKSVQSRETSPTVATINPSHNFEQPSEASIPNDSPPHITIDSESMQVDSTNVIVDRTKDPFKDFGPTIVGNIVDYNSSIDEDKEEEQKQKKVEEVFVEKLVEVVRDSTVVATTIVPIAIVKLTPSTPLTQATV